MPLSGRGSHRESGLPEAEQTGRPGCALPGLYSLCILSVHHFLIRCLLGKSSRAKTSTAGRFLAGPFQSGTTTKDVKEGTRLKTTKQ